MSNYTGDYKYPSDPFSFGTTKILEKQIKDIKEEAKAEEMKKELPQFRYPTRKSAEILSKLLGDK